MRRLVDKITQRERIEEMRTEARAARADADEERLERTKILEGAANVTADGLEQAGLKKEASQTYQSAALLANRRRALEARVGRERALVEGMFPGVKRG